jgi:hypothetical protein
MAALSEPALVPQAVASSWQGDYALGSTLLEQAVGLFRDAGATWGIAYSLLNLGGATYLRRDYLQAAELLEQSVTLRDGCHRLLGWPGGRVVRGSSAIESPAIMMASVKVPISVL